MKGYKLYTILFLSIFTLYSCTKVPNHTKYIPKNTLGVFSINMDNLSKKMLWNILTGSDLFKEMQNDIKNEDSKNALKDVSNIGLDPISVLYAFYLGDLRDNKNIYIAMAMKDDKKFESFLSKNYPTIQVQKAAKYNYSVIEEKIYLSWNKDVLIAIPMIPKYDYDEKADSVVTNYPMNEYSMELEKIYSLDSKNSIRELPNFVSLQKDDHDFSLWINYEELFKLTSDFTDATVKMFMKDKFVKDAALAVGVDFEKGAIDMVMNYYFSKELASIYKKNINSSFDVSLLQYIPSDSITALITYNLKPQFFQDILKEFNLDGLLNLALSAVGLSTDDIFKTFKGDILFAITDLKGQVKLNNIDSLESTPDFNIYYSMGLNDVSKLQTIIQKGIKENIIKKNEDVYTSSDGSVGGMMFDKDKLVFSNKIENVKKVMSEGKKSKDLLPSKVFNQIKNNPIAFYCDIEKVFQVIPDNSMSEEDKKVFAEFQKLFTYSIIYGGGMKGNANHFEGHLYFTNKDENAMIQLLNLAMKVKKSFDIKKEKEEKEENIIDTLNV